METLHLKSDLLGTSSVIAICYYQDIYNGMIRNAMIDKNTSIIH